MAQFLQDVKDEEAREAEEIRKALHAESDAEKELEREAEEEKRKVGANVGLMK